MLMHSLALSGVVLVSVLGALVTVFVMLRWGSPVADAALDEDYEGETDEAARRLVRMVRRDRAALRERAVRLGQAVAVVCFASAAVLSVIAWTSGITRRTTDVDARATQMKETQARLEERVRTLEQRLAAAKAQARVPSATSGGPTAAPSAPAEERTKPAPSSPVGLPSRAPASPRAEPLQRNPPPSAAVSSARRPGPPPPTGEGPATANAPSAPPPGAGTIARTSVGSVKVEILRDPEQPAPGAPMTCTVRLSDIEGAPLTGADVTVYGRTADGSTVQTKLEPTKSAGTYAGAIVVTSMGPWDLRLRVAQREATFELDLERPAAW